MKSLLSLLTATFLWAFTATAQHHDSTPAEPDYRKLGGVAFESSPIDNVFEQARVANRPVFVEIYSPSCPHCQELMPSFASKKVGDFYNQHFVCTKLVISDKATVEFLEQKKLTIPEISFLLFFEPGGKLIHLSQTEKNEDAVIAVATTALNPAIRSESYPQHFANGVRTANFLLEYGLATIVSRNWTANKAVMEAYAQLIPTTEYTSELSWAALNKRIQHVDNPIAQHLISNQEEYKKFGAAAAQAVAEKLIMGKLYGPDANTLTSGQILHLRAMLEKIGIPPANASARTILPELSAYFREKQTEKAVTRLDTQITKSPLTVPECIYVVRFFNQNSPSIADVSAIAKWTGNALKDSQITLAQKADLYYELAEACRRANKKDEARKAAEASLQAAKAGKLDTKRNIEQLKVIE